MIKTIHICVLWSFLVYKSVFSISLAVNTLILRRNRNWTSIECPNAAERSDRDDRTTNGVTFNCRLVERDKNLVPRRYHISMFPVLESVIPGCSRLDDCFRVELTQEMNIVRVHARPLKSCLFAKILFRIELRQGNTLVNKNFVYVFFSRKPEKATDLRVVKGDGNVFTIEGLAIYTCSEELDSLRYVMNYHLTGMECSTTNHTGCSIKARNNNNNNNNNGNKLYISCSVPYLCDDPQLLCSSRITAHVYGTNRLGQVGDRNRKLSALLSYSDLKPLALRVTEISLNSLTMTFDSPVACTSSYQQFQYKVSYMRKGHQRSSGGRWEYLNRKSCTSKTCSLYISGLELNSHYNVCLSYRNVFDFRSFYTVPLCILGSTAQLPCQAPVITNLTHVELGAIHWTAGVYWNQLDVNCWNEEEMFPASASNRFYKIRITDGNSSRIFRKSYTKNSSLDGLNDLSYDHKYTLVLSTCNSYGCTNGPKNVLYISKRRNEPRVQYNNSTNPTVTETILICVVSLVFLAATTFLYLLVKKRKRRLRLKRMRTDNMELMEGTFVRDTIALSYALTTECATRTAALPQDEVVDNSSGGEQFPLEHHLIQVDTRPLVSHHVSVPKNSTLV